MSARVFNCSLLYGTKCYFQVTANQFAFRLSLPRNLR